MNKELKQVEQKMMFARENKARSGATLEGLENRKKDLINTLRNDLNIEEKNELIEIDSKYYDTEKKSSEDLNVTKNRLTAEVDKVKELVNAQKMMKQ